MSASAMRSSCSIILKQEGIPVLAQDLQDKHASKIYFFPRAGRVLVKKLARVNNDTLARREREYQERLARDDATRATSNCSRDGTGLTWAPCEDQGAGGGRLRSHAGRC
jgi:hypothetical protein